jgi:hypothetical protein
MSLFPFRVSHATRELGILVLHMPPFCDAVDLIIFSFDGNQSSGFFIKIND